MNNTKILIVEDSDRWIENYKLIFDSYPYQIDSAPSAKEGILKLVKKHYDLVILDLSLDPNNAYNRDSLKIQKHLKETSEGVKCIVVSAHAGFKDARIAGFEYKNSGIFHKSELGEDIVEFLNKVEEAIKDKKTKPYNFASDYIKITGEGIHKEIMEYDLSVSLKNEGTTRGIEIFIKNKLLPIISPIKQHKTRHSFSLNKKEKFASGLFWSRNLGKPVSLYLFNYKQSLEEDISNKHNKWLGWSAGNIITKVEDYGLRAVICDEEENIDVEEFLIPLDLVD